MASSLHQLLFRFVIPTHLNVLGSAFLFAYWAINLELFHLNVTLLKGRNYLSVVGRVFKPGHVSLEESLSGLLSIDLEDSLCGSDARFFLPTRLSPSEMAFPSSCQFGLFFIFFLEELKDHLRETVKSFVE